jgi:hypothetical protein
MVCCGRATTFASVSLSRPPRSSERERPTENITIGGSDATALK